MLKVKIGEKEYKLRFGYGALCKSDLLKRVMEITKVAGNDDAFQRMIQTVCELFLAGVQKYHKDEFAYDTDDEKQKQLEKIYDLLDDYEDGGTKENPQDGFELFQKMSEELIKNGFLSGVMNILTEEAAKKRNAAVLPAVNKKSAKK